MTLFERIGRAGQGIASGWDDGDVERVWQGLRRKRRRRAVAAGAGLSAVGLVVAAALVLRPGGAVMRPGSGSRPGQEARTATASGPPADEPPRRASARQAHPSSDPSSPTPATGGGLRLSDGSTVVPWGAGAEPGALAVVEDGPRRIRVALGRGGARFDVVRRPGRVFSVRAGEVTVSVLGTAFSVERVADRVGVVVTRGAVLVDWRVGSRRLGAAEDGGHEVWFPPLVVAPRTAPARPAAAENDGRRGRRASALSEGSALGGTGADPAPAPRAIPPASVADEPERGNAISPQGRATSETVAPPVVERGEESAGALLANADRARLAGRFEEGASLLRRLVDEHPADQRAPLAAFSLGRLLLGELGRPGEAARAFARARALAPEGPLAEDALAREAEAWARAKDLGRARARAAEYARTYPNGRRAADVTDAVGRATSASSSP